LLIISEKWNCSGLDYEYKAVNLAKGEQFSTGEVGRFHILSLPRI
jgi:hypothetical protein